MSEQPFVRSIAAGARSSVAKPALSNAPAPPAAGRVTLRDPDGGRHVVEVFLNTGASNGQYVYQVRVDGWYHVTWATTTDDVQRALDRLRRCITEGWLPGDSDLPQ